MALAALLLVVLGAPGTATPPAAAATWLRFGTTPVVPIGLGATPYGVIPNRYG